MKKLILILAAAIVVGCSTTQTTPPLTEPSAPPPAVVNQGPPPVSVAIKEGDACWKYNWKGDRGQATDGFIFGVAMSYKLAKARGDTGRPLGSPAKDALAHYGLGSGDELLKTYAFLIGLGMRESSGNYTMGRDYIAKGPQNSATAEAGAWQFSYDSIGADPELRQIYEKYQKTPEACLAPLFGFGLCDPKKGKCPNREQEIKTDGYITTPGAGYEFQKFMRSCPRAQVEYAAVAIRVLRQHFGPINRREVEYNKNCEAMLRSIE